MKWPKWLGVFAPVDPEICPIVNPQSGRPRITHAEARAIAQEVSRETVEQLEKERSPHGSPTAVDLCNELNASLEVATEEARLEMSARDARIKRLEELIDDHEGRIDLLDLRMAES